MTIKQLNKSQLNNLKIKKIVKDALAEDIRTGDITTEAIISEKQRAKAGIIAKEAGVIAGLEVAREVFRQVDRRIKFTPRVLEGSRVRKWEVIANLSGPARGILTGERVALNFLQHLSGIATLTNQFVKKLKSKKVKILDTRKTIPGMRVLEKYAVKVGGGVNHRMGLYDAILIKDNHIKLAGGIERAIKAVKAERAEKAKGAERAIEVEAKTIDEVGKAIRAGVDRILLDNMGVKSLRQAVRLCKKAGVKTEASGGVNLENIRAIAGTGVDHISIGALTHSAPALDISLKVTETCD